MERRGGGGGSVGVRAPVSGLADPSQAPSRLCLPSSLLSGGVPAIATSLALPLPHSHHLTGGALLHGPGAGAAQAGMLGAGPGALVAPPQSAGAGVGGVPMAPPASSHTIGLGGGGGAAALQAALGSPATAFQPPLLARVDTTRVAPRVPSLGLLHPHRLAAPTLAAASATPATPATPTLPLLTHARAPAPGAPHATGLLGSRQPQGLPSAVLPAIAGAADPQGLHGLPATSPEPAPPTAPPRAGPTPAGEGEGRPPRAGRGRPRGQRKRRQQEFRCPECSKVFTREGHLSVHARVHTGEKPFACEHCQKSFGDKPTLTRHMRVHSGERPYSCEVCSKSFNQSGNLRTHMRVHSGQKPFMCTLCNKGYTALSSLRTHMRSHTGEKPYTCATCKRSFSQIGHLKTHELIHTGERPFLCTLCGKQFRVRFALKSHMRTHRTEASSAAPLAVGLLAASTAADDPAAGGAAARGVPGGGVPTAAGPLDLDHPGGLPLSPPPSHAQHLPPPPFPTLLRPQLAQHPQQHLHLHPPDADPRLGGAAMPATQQLSPPRLLPVQSSSVMVQLPPSMAHAHPSPSAGGADDAASQFPARLIPEPEPRPGDVASAGGQRFAVPHLLPLSGRPAESTHQVPGAALAVAHHNAEDLHPHHPDHQRLLQPPPQQQHVSHVLPNELAGAAELDPLQALYYQELGADAASIASMGWATPQFQPQMMGDDQGPYLLVDHVGDGGGGVPLGAVGVGGPSVPGHQHHQHQPHPPALHHPHHLPHAAAAAMHVPPRQQLLPSTAELPDRVAFLPS